MGDTGNPSETYESAYDADVIAVGIVGAAQEAVLRAGTDHPDPSPTEVPTAAEGLVTLQEAASRTGASVSVLRKWTKTGLLASSRSGTRIQVALADVETLAAERLGNRAAPTMETAGGIMVPVDAWNRVMDQLGHLHSAGRELAEARERAGRAEARAEFLEQRLAELRQPETVEPAPVAPDPQPVERATPVERARRWWRGK